jgi:hypothetical protein
LVAIFGDSVRDYGRMEAAGTQLPPAHESLSVGHLKDPRTGGAFRSIKELAPAVNVQKDFLNEIVCLDAIPERPLAHSSDQSGVTSEEYSKSVFPTCRNHRQQRFIGGLR